MTPAVFFVLHSVMLPILTDDKNGESVILPLLLPLKEEGDEAEEVK